MYCTESSLHVCVARALIGRLKIDYRGPMILVPRFVNLDYVIGILGPK